MGRIRRDVLLWIVVAILSERLAIQHRTVEALRQSAMPTMHHLAIAHTAAAIKHQQFGLRAIFWIVLVIGIALAYLRNIGPPRVILMGAIIVITAVIVGAVIGWCAGRVRNSMYWAVLISAAAFLSVAGERAYGPMFLIAWSAVGMSSGACCGCIAQGKLLRRMLVGSLSAAGTMLVFSAGLSSSAPEVLFDFACAPIVGALVGLLIEIILWLESEDFAPRYITASWLLCAVVIGNLLVPLINR